MNAGMVFMIFKATNDGRRSVIKFAAQNRLPIAFHVIIADE